MGCLTILLLWLFFEALSFVLVGGIVWLLCWALPAIGVVTIGSWAVVFSWKLVLVIWLVWSILASIFKTNVSVKK